MGQPVVLKCCYKVHIKKRIHQVPYNMVKYFGIDFAPANVPLERRLQTFMVLVSTMSFTIWPIVCVLLCLFLLFTPLFWMVLLYVSWIFYDVSIRKTSSRGGRRVQFFRRLYIWKYFADYFPMKLLKTAELSNKQNYIMGYHPHGIMGCGAVGNFATNATGFSKKFPGIRPHLLTLQVNFKIPLLRGFLLWNGMCDVSKESIQWIVTKQGSGNAAIIVVGGAEEALEAHPGNYKLTLKDRKGFIKMALKTGAHLVPIFSFGENDLFVQADNPHGSKLRNFQTKFKKLLGFSPPIFHGRGVFNYTFGTLPYRKPINTVVGAPIEVEKNEHPDQEDIDRLHAKYLDGLSAVFDDHKVDFGIDENVKLEYV